MISTNRLGAAAVFALVCACGSGRKTTASASRDDPSSRRSSDPPKVTFDERTVDAGASLHMSLGPCYGSCPVYSVEVTGDGKVKFEGKEYVHSKGKQEKTLPREATVALFRMLVERGTLDTKWDTNCGKGHATDHSSVRLTLSIGGKKNDIDHDLGDECAPKDLTETYSLVDKLAELEPWIKCQPGDDCESKHP